MAAATGGTLANSTVTYDAMNRLMATSFGPARAQAAVIAKARSNAAAAQLKQAQARRTMTEAALAPQEFGHEMEPARAGAPARLQHAHE